MESLNYLFIVICVFLSLVTLIVICVFCMLMKRGKQNIIPPHILSEPEPEDKDKYNKNKPREIKINDTISKKERMLMEENIAIQREERMEKLLRDIEEDKKRKNEQQIAEEEEEKRKNQNTQLALMFIAGAAFNELSSKNKEKEKIGYVPQYKSPKNHIDFDEVEDDDYR